MATIRDVAARAGVSVATVSRWLSGQHVRTAVAVQRAVEELDYRPNASAQSLRTGHRGTIGVVVPDITNPFFAAIVKGLERGMPRGSFRILLASSDESAEQEREILADLTGRVDGFVLVPAVESDQAPSELQRARVPAVLLDREIPGSESHDVVLIDNINGARMAAEHLIDLGHHRVGMIHGPDDTTPGRERRAGFKAAFVRAGIGLDPAMDRTGDFREDSGRNLTLELMTLADPPTALFSANNQMTIGALKALRELDVRIPDEVSIVGFDDLTLGSLLQPPLTCVSRPVEEQGEFTMQMLLERIHDPEFAPPRRVVMATYLEVRGSTAPPARRRHRQDSAPGRPRTGR